MASLMPLGKQQYLSANGAPLVGGKVYTYAAGTTTPLATYSDKAGVTPNTNPVILDSRGEATIFWGSAGYKVVLKDSTDVTVWTQDNLYASLDATSTTSAALITYTPAGTGAVATTVQAKLRESVSVKDFGAVGDGVTDDTAAINLALASGASRVYLPYTSTGYLVTGALTYGASLQVFYGDIGSKLNCRTSTFSGTFLTIGTSTLTENITFFGDSAAQGTLASVSSTTGFVGNARLHNVIFNTALVGLEIGKTYGAYNIRLTGCEFRSCGTGTVMSPNHVTNGYLNTVTFRDCYWLGNTLYDVYSSPQIRTSNVTFDTCTFDPGATTAKVYTSTANPLAFYDCYFEGDTAVPAFSGRLSYARFFGSYFIGTAGFTYDGTQGQLTIERCRLSGSTCVVNAGNVLHTVTLIDTGLPSSGNTLPAATFYARNAEANGTTYNEYAPMLQTRSGVAFPATQVASADPNTLDDYDEYTAASTACTGAITTAVVWKLVKVGNVVTLSLPNVYQTSPAASASFTFGVAIPSKYRPSTSQYFLVLIDDNGASQASPGRVVINASTGVMTVSKSATGTGNWTAAGQGGLNAASLSWVI